jgi:hypothetical protein
MMKDRVNLDGELVAQLLDLDEYPSNLGNVAAISDQQICFLRRDSHKLTHLKLEYFDVHDCSAIEYRTEVAYPRILAAGACFVAASISVLMLVTTFNGDPAVSAPLVIAVLGLAALGIRFSSSIHRHVIRFEMPDEVLVWRSPAIDYKSKAEAAHAVCEYARQRGIFGETIVDT